MMQGGHFLKLAHLYLLSNIQYLPPNQLPEPAERPCWYMCYCSSNLTQAIVRLPQCDCCAALPWFLFSLQFLFPLLPLSSFPPPVLHPPVLSSVPSHFPPALASCKGRFRLTLCRECLGAHCRVIFKMIHIIEAPKNKLVWNMTIIIKDRAWSGVWILSKFRERGCNHQLHCKTLFGDMCKTHALCEDHQQKTLIIRRRASSPSDSMLQLKLHSSPTLLEDCLTSPQHQHLLCPHHPPSV